MEQATYLEHIISGNGIRPDSSKTAAVAEYPTPKDTKQLKQFLGLANYYRHFVKQYATIAEPLHKFLRGKQKHFSWDERCSEAFKTLKTHLVKPPSLPFQISTIHSFSIQMPQMWQWVLFWAKFKMAQNVS